MKNKEDIGNTGLLESQKMALQQYYEGREEYSEEDIKKAINPLEERQEEEKKETYEEVPRRPQRPSSINLLYRKISKIESILTPEFSKETVKSLLANSKFLQEETKIAEVTTNYLNSQYNFDENIGKISELSGQVKGIQKELKGEREKTQIAAKIAFPTVTGVLFTTTAFGAYIGNTSLFAGGLSLGIASLVPLFGIFWKA